MKNNMKKICSAVLLFGMAIGMLVLPKTACFAAEAKVDFEKNNYAIEADKELTVGIQIDCDEKAGAYYVKVNYDTDRLEYLGGADKEKDGSIILEGTAVGSKVKYELHFDCISGGESGLCVESAYIKTFDTNREMDILSLGETKVEISGEDTSGAKAYALSSEIPVVGVIRGNDGNKYQVVDMLKYESNTFVDDMDLEEIELEDSTIWALTDSLKKFYYVYLLDDQQTVHLYVIGNDGTLYRCLTSGDKIYIGSDFLENNFELLGNDSYEDGTFCMVGTDGSIAFVQENDGDIVRAIPKEVDVDPMEHASDEDKMKDSIMKKLPIGIAIFFILVIGVYFYLFVYNNPRRRY